MARRADADFSDIDLNKDSKKLLSALLARETFKPNPSLGGSVLNGLAMGLMGLNEKQDEERGLASQGAIVERLYGGSKPLPGSVSPAVTAAPDGAVSPQALAGALQGQQPRGYRNMNPLNIEDGPFAQGQQGYAGTDGRFAKFASMDHGLGAANKLMDVYQNKHGLNTVGGIINRWAPASDGNNVQSYISNVAKQAGIAPDQPLTPETRQSVIGAMAQHENGRPLPQQPVQMAQVDPRIDEVRRMYDDKTNGISPSQRARMGQWLIQQKTKPPETTDEIKEYRLYKQEGGPKNFNDWKIDLKRASATNVTTNVGGGSDKQIFDAMDEHAKSARTAATGLTSLRTARSAIEGGAITGFAANPRLQFQKLGAALGLANSDRIVNTETFRAAIAPQVAAVMKATVGNVQISNADREFAERAAGGDITLDERSIARLLDIMERGGKVILDDHQKRIDRVYPDKDKYSRERAIFGVEAPAEAPRRERIYNPATGKIE
jgi:hypothetical protein